MATLVVGHKCGVIKSGASKYMYVPAAQCPVLDVQQRYLAEKQKKISRNIANIITCGGQVSHDLLLYRLLKELRNMCAN